jgi:hypothetical protein
LCPQISHVVNIDDINKRTGSGKMKKKILIIGFFTSVMLLVPLASISDGSTILNNTIIEVNPINFYEPSFIYCFILKMMFLSLTVLYINFEDIGNKNISQLIFNIAFTIFEYGIEIGCWDDPPAIFESEIGLKLKIKFQIIVGLVQSQEINMCPCRQ